MSEELVNVLKTVFEGPRKTELKIEDLDQMEIYPLLKDLPSSDRITALAICLYLEDSSVFPKPEEIPLSLQRKIESSRHNKQIASSALSVIGKLLLDKSK